MIPKLKTLFTFVFLFVSFNFFAQETKSPLTIGEIITIKSQILSEERTLNLYLPDGYKTQDSLRYPVIYALDGSMNEDFIHLVGLVQFYNLQMNMPKTIVVGITNVDRKRDFTFPTTDKELKEAFPTTGGSEKFITFIEDELQPYIESNYKVNTTKMIIGQSLGGLLASEILLKKPHLFTNYIIVSPSLWWDNETLIDNAKTLFSQQKDVDLHVYVSVGTEGKVMERTAKELSEVLKKSGKKNLKTDFVFLPKENHATILHQSVNEAFKILYPYIEPK